MNLFPLLLEALRQRGGAAVWVWAGLMLSTWLVFAYGSDRPLKGTELLGAGFVYGALVLGVSAVVARRRGPPPPRPPRPAKKKRR